MDSNVAVGGASNAGGENKELKVDKARIKAELISIVSGTVPGFLQFLDIVARNESGRSVVDILFEDPAALYKLLVKVYRDEYSADFTMRILLSTLVEVSGSNLDVEELLKPVKLGEGRKVIELIFEQQG